eukprot:14052845-Heterocapsa_arctica.AAC.1
MHPTMKCVSSERTSIVVSRPGGPTTETSMTRSSGWKPSLLVASRSRFAAPGDGLAGAARCSLPFCAS